MEVVFQLVIEKLNKSVTEEGIRIQAEKSMYNTNHGAGKARKTKTR